MHSSRVLKIYNQTVDIARALKPTCQFFREFHVAAIFDRQRVRAIGYNSGKSHSKAARFGFPSIMKGLHAEAMAVIRGKLEDYSDHTLIVVRIDNNGKVACSKPCEFCQKLLGMVSFQQVFYSGTDGRCHKYD
jgi:hypothetical protein